MNGISEWNYDIPIAFKILLSANTRKCRSSIWEVPEEIAIVGDYDPGVDRLLRFLDRIELPEINPLKVEARQFLAADDTNKKRYFVLECGEIFEMDDEPLVEQNDRLLAEIRNLEPVMESALASLATDPPSKANSGGFFSRLFGIKPAPPEKKRDAAEMVHSLGLGNWSNILYFDLSKPQRPTEQTRHSE